MHFLSSMYFLGFNLNRKHIYTRVHADWASGAEVALAWRLRGARVDDDVVWPLIDSVGSVLDRWISDGRSGSGRRDRTGRTGVSVRGPLDLKWIGRLRLICVSSSS